MDSTPEGSEEFAGSSRNCGSLYVIAEGEIVYSTSPTSDDAIEH
jgi:hypothetical protein